MSLVLIRIAGDVYGMGDENSLDSETSHPHHTPKITLVEHRYILDMARRTLKPNDDVPLIVRAISLYLKQRPEVSISDIIQLHKIYEKEENGNG